MEYARLDGVKAQSWCLVSQHRPGVPATIVFGDPKQVLGIASDGFDEEALEAAVVGEVSRFAWREPIDKALYLFSAGGGSARWVEVSSVALPEGGLLVSSRPAQLGDYEELLLRARLSLGGSLLGPMAHELNNLVQGLSSAEYLFRDCLENGDAIEMEDVDQLAEAVVGLKGMGAQLQSFARITLAPAEAVSLPRILTRAAKFLSSLGRMGIVDFTNAVPEDLPDMHWRALEIDFVVLALLANAVDASLVNGQDPEVFARAKSLGETIELEFGNSGPPLDLAAHSKPGITTKQRNRHLGLGLSAVMAVLSRRGGSAEQVESGETTVLRVVLPLRAREEAA